MEGPATLSDLSAATGKPMPKLKAILYCLKRRNQVTRFGTDTVPNGRGRPFHLWTLTPKGMTQFYALTDKYALVEKVPRA